MSIIVERITELQEARGLTNRAVETGAGLANSVISQWKKGKGKPSLDAIVKLSNYFNVSTDYLIGTSTNMEIGAEISLTEEELLLIDAYRSSSTQGKFRIIQTCMNEKDSKRENKNVG